MGNLSARSIWKLPPGRHSDGATLSLLVQPGGSRSWCQRLTILGTRCDLGLGSAMLVSLSKARQRALANRVLVADGGDPRAEKRRRRAQAVQAAAVPSFRRCADLAFEANRGRWRGARAAREWDQQLERYAFPVLGDMPINEIGRADVLKALESTWTAKPALGRKLKTRLRSIFAWAAGSGHIETNPVDLAAGALPAQRAVKRHHLALPYQEVGGALNVIAASTAPETSRAALRFAILTASRSGETRGARWAEFDFEAGEWRIPPSRMKANREHRVPLSSAAQDVLERMRQHRGPSDLVFPSLAKPGTVLSDMALMRVLRGCGLAERASVHGFRSSFRDWASECTSAPHAVCEMALAHQVGSEVERSYARSDLFDKRRDLMDKWADYIA